MDLFKFDKSSSVIQPPVKIAITETIIVFIKTSFLLLILCFCIISFKFY